MFQNWGRLYVLLHITCNDHTSKLQITNITSMTVIINLYVESQYFKMYLATKKHLKALLISTKKVFLEFLMLFPT